MEMIFFCLMGSGMFAGSAPSLRIRALGPDMAYLVCDTLADTRLNPASGHRAFISGYGLVLDTPGFQPIMLRVMKEATSHGEPYRA